MKSKNLYIIGGGDNESQKMRDHQENIYNLAKEVAGHDNPNIVLLPTAHHNGTRPEQLPHRDFFANRFKDLGANVDEILIGDMRESETPHSPNEVRTLLEQADAIFVLNGDTRYLVAQLLKAGLVDDLKKAYEQGVILAGSSAGSLLPGKEFMSDSRAYDGTPEWDYMYLEGLGIIPHLINAHDNQGIRDRVNPAIDRSERFNQMVQEKEDKGIALPEYVAIHFRDDLGTVIKFEDSDPLPDTVELIDGQVKRTPFTEIHL